MTFCSPSQVKHTQWFSQFEWKIRIPGLHACLHGVHVTVSVRPVPEHEPTRYFPKPQSEVHCGQKQTGQVLTLTKEMKPRPWLAEATHSQVEATYRFADYIWGLLVVACLCYVHASTARYRALGTKGHVSNVSTTCTAYRNLHVKCTYILACGRARLSADPCDVLSLLTSIFALPLRSVLT
jgi:hypothetical protein